MKRKRSNVTAAWKCDVKLDYTKYSTIYNIWTRLENDRYGQEMNEELAKYRLNGSLEADVAQWMDKCLGGLVLPDKLEEVRLINVDAGEISPVAGSLWCLNTDHVLDLIGSY